jgi:hypothetical protein
MTTVQATILSAMISAIVALIVVSINKYFKNRKSKRKKYDTVKKYANPIVLASEQLAWRLKEILEFKGAYLLPNAPLNGFFKYKFDSTVYRLNSLLGWIHAAKKEQSYLEGTKGQQHEKIQAAISEFQRILADGSHVEVSILGDLAQLYNVAIGSLTESKRASIGVELENIIFRYIPDNVKRNVVNLPQEKQSEMLKQIMDYVCTTTNQRIVPQNIIDEKKISAIHEIAREFCWIYRDWQAAIGEEMITKIQGANRRYDVIGFPEFEFKHNNSNWIKKTDGLFADLDVSVDDRFDSRVKQLKQVYESLMMIIATFRKIVKKNETISDSSFITLNEFNKVINNRSIELPKKKFSIIIKFE